MHRLVLVKINKLGKLKQTRKAYIVEAKGVRSVFNLAAAQYNNNLKADADRVGQTLSRTRRDNIYCNNRATHQRLAEYCKNYDNVPTINTNSITATHYIHLHPEQCYARHIIAKAPRIYRYISPPDDKTSTPSSPQQLVYSATYVRVQLQPLRSGFAIVARTSCLRGGGGVVHTRAAYPKKALSHFMS